jgi:hypothetical protein
VVAQEVDSVQVEGLEVDLEVEEALVVAEAVVLVEDQDLEVVRELVLVVGLEEVVVEDLEGVVAVDLALLDLELVEDLVVELEVELEMDFHEYMSRRKLLIFIKHF